MERRKKIIENILAKNLLELKRDMHPHIESAFQVLSRVNKKEVHIYFLKTKVILKIFNNLDGTGTDTSEGCSF